MELMSFLNGCGKDPRLFGHCATFFQYNFHLFLGYPFTLINVFGLKKRLANVMFFRHWHFCPKKKIRNTIFSKNSLFWCFKLGKSGGRVLCASLLVCFGTVNLMNFWQKCPFHVLKLYCMFKKPFSFEPWLVGVPTCFHCFSSLFQTEIALNSLIRLSLLSCVKSVFWVFWISMVDCKNCVFYRLFLSISQWVLLECLIYLIGGV